MSQALTPFLGTAMGNLVFGLGVLGAGMVAAIVCSLAFAWGLGEVTGYRRSLEYRPLEARWFYGVYAACVVAGVVAVALWPNLVTLNVGVQVMNALLLPLVLGFLIALSVRALPRRVPAARGLLVAGGRRRGADLRVGRVRRAVRRGIVLTAGGGWKARHPRSRTEKPLPWTCPWDVLLGRVLGTCPWDMPMGRVPRR